MLLSESLEPIKANFKNDFSFSVNNFDLLRVLAAFQVVLAHGWHHLGLEVTMPLIGKILSLFPGVPIFFTVSGFLIAASWERNKSVKSYLRNRLLRIYPAMWVCFFVSLVSVFVFYNSIFSFKEFFFWVVAQMTIVQFYNPEFLRGYGVGVLNGSLWTIPVELQFYIVLPFLYKALDYFKWKRLIFYPFILLFLFVSQIFAYKFAGNGSFAVKVFSVTVIPYLYMFFFGIILQRNLLFVQRFLVGRAIWWLIAFLVIQFATFKIGLHVQGSLINPFSYVLLAFLTISFAYSYTGKSSKALRGNDISYGIYIYHMVFFNILLHVNVFSQWGNLGLMIALTLVSAILSWRFVEKPCLALKKVQFKK